MGLLFHPTLSYGKQTDDQRATERAISQDAYNALLRKFGTRIASIFDTQRRVSGQGFSSCLKKKRSKLWTHTLQHLSSRPSATMTSNLSNVFFTIPQLTFGCQMNTRAGVILSSSHCVRTTGIIRGIERSRPRRKYGTRPGTYSNLMAKEESHEHYHHVGALDRDIGRQRLAQLGVLPSGAGPKAQMSRASVPFLSLK